jgi:hypothetical protein
MQILFVLLTVWITGFLFVLNIVLAIVFRARPRWEVISYYAVCAIELAIFVFALLIRLNVIAQIPYHLPPGLPVNATQLGAALAIGLGLFPAAYWHRINLSDLPKRIAEDANTMKGRDPGVRIRKSGPGEWMN